MKDRVPAPGLAGRVEITPENGNPAFYARMAMAANAIDGTDLNKATLLSDETAESLGLESADPTVDEAFRKIADSKLPRAGGDLTGNLNISSNNARIFMKRNVGDSADYVGVGFKSEDDLVTLSGIQYSYNKNELSVWKNGAGYQPLWSGHNLPVESGTWTPTIFGSTTAGTATGISNYSHYTKIGRLVHLVVFVNCTFTGGVGQFRIGNIPFPSKSECYGIVPARQR